MAADNQKNEMREFTTKFGDLQRNKKLSILNAYSNG